MPVAQSGINDQLAANPRKFYGAEQTVPPVYEGGSQQNITPERVSRQGDQALNSDLRVFFRKIAETFDQCLWVGDDDPVAGQIATACCIVLTESLYGTRAGSGSSAATRLPAILRTGGRQAELPFPATKNSVAGRRQERRQPPVCRRVP